MPVVWKIICSSWLGQYMQFDLVYVNLIYIKNVQYNHVKLNLLWFCIVNWNVENIRFNW
jgi:hypothetical protein